MVASNTRDEGNICDFGPICRHISEAVQDRDIVMKR